MLSCYCTLSRILINTVKCFISGYEGHYIKRTGDKLDGCATFYKTAKFSLLEAIPLPYQQSNTDILKRENVALILKLKPKGAHIPRDRCIVVANTHLLFNPRRGDIKLAQLIMLLAEMDKCAHYVNKKGEHDYQAVIMCGDFNSLPHSDIYQFIQMGFLRYEDLLIKNMSGQEEGLRKPGYQRLGREFFPPELQISDNCQHYSEVMRRHSQHDVQMSPDLLVQSSGYLRHSLQLLSSYEHQTCRGDRYYPELTTHHGNAACTVDYIFYGVRSCLVRFYRGRVETSNVSEGHLCLLGRYGLLTERELDTLGSLPNKFFGSDHLSLMSKFLLT